MELPSPYSSEWALRLSPGGGCRGDAPRGRGVSIAPGALSAWHGSSADFSPGDSEVIAGLWRAHPAQPLSGVFCCFIFANVAMPLVLPPRTDTASAPTSPLPTTAVPAWRQNTGTADRRHRARVLAPGGGKAGEERHTVPPVFCKTWLWKEVLYLQSVSSFCNILPNAHPTSTSDQQGKCSS